MIGLRKRRNSSITRDQALAAKPRRLVDAELALSDDSAGGGGALKAPLAPPRWGRWLFRVPPGATKTYELDAIGVFVWNLCDGRTSVQQIIRKLAKEYNLNLREAEVPTIQFLQTLARKGLIGMSVEQR
jgi:hypothetical protein